MRRWIKRARDALAYYRDAETAVRAIGAALVLAVGFGIGTSWMVSQLQGVPAWLTLAAGLATWLLLGVVAVVTAVRVQSRGAHLNAAPPPPTPAASPRTPHHDAARYRTFGDVLWHLVDTYAFSNNPRADGPLCPDDKATLSFQGLRYSNEGVRAVQNDDFANGHYGVLVCPVCGRRFVVPDQIKDVRGQVERAFAGDIRSGKIRL